MKNFLWAITVAISVGLIACGGKSTNADSATSSGSAKEGVATTENALNITANADSLYKFVETQILCGPRNPGSKGHERCRKYLVESLKAFGVDTVIIQQQPVTIWNGEKHTVYNILGRINPTSKDRILLLAHYDTRPWADEDPDERYRQTPIDGANDGASGVAVLLETARCLQSASLQKLGIDLLMVDLEDSGRYNDNDSWCVGTQQWVEAMPYTIDNRPMYGILFDMVGGINARFNREHISQSYAKPIVDKIWALANASGYADRFPNTIGGSIVDDHLYINQAGIPCIDIIESANPQTESFNPTWHTVSDNLAAIDRETMRIVTQVVLNLIAREEKQ